MSLDSTHEADPQPGTAEWRDLFEAASREFEEWKGRATPPGDGRPFARRTGQAPPRLSDDSELHQQLGKLATSSLGRRYLTHDVLGSPTQTFGIEIEFDGGDVDAIAAELYDLGLTSSRFQASYHSPLRVPGKWLVENDLTVTGEIVSPVLTDTPETWRDLQVICATVKKHGGRATKRTGAHVHVGVASTGFRNEVE